MRHARKESPTWPFLLVLVVLLVFTATAPRGWERTARQQPVSDQLPESSSTKTAATKARRKAARAARLSSSQPIEQQVEARVLAPAISQVLPVLEQPFAVGQPPAEPSATPAPTLIVDVASRLAGPEPLPPVESEPAADRPEAAPPAAAQLDSNPAVLEPLASVKTATAPPVPTVAEAESEPPEPVTHDRSPTSSEANLEPASKPAAEQPSTAIAVAEQAPAATTPAVEPWWPVPHGLLAELNGLKQQPAIGGWATRASALIEELVASGPPQEGRAEEIVLELRSLVASPGNFLTDRPGQQLASLRKAQFALARRLDFWQDVIDCQSPAAQNSASAADARRLALCLEEIEKQTADADMGAAWRAYLLLKELRQLAAERDVDAGRELARAALARFESRSLTARQREFLASPALVELQNQLRGWAAEPVDLRQLLVHVEQFEGTGLPSQAAHLAGDFNRLAHSVRSGDEALARQLDIDYRNANLRVSLSPEFLNRLVPPQRPRLARVRDLFMGHPTEGWSSTDTQVVFRPIPDLHRLHVALEARGQTSSEADTSNGPVLIHTHSDSHFRGWKEVTVGPDGVQSVPAEAEAESSPRLRWVKTDLDFIPIVGTVVRDIARAQHEESQEEVRTQSRRKIRREVTEQIDAELAPRIARANERLKQRIIDPLEGLGIDAVMIEARTSADRLTTRLRLAGSEQLAGSSPRPRAPANCLASVQMHQSAMNNICQQLGWEGKTFTLAQLREELATKLRWELDAAPTNAPKDLTVTFAAENAIHIACEDGRVQLNLAFARLQKRPESFRDFVVRVYYKPDLENSSGRLVRDGTVQLIGDRLRPKAQVALRGVFSKTFSPSRWIRLVPAGIAERPGLAELRVVQCEIREGWLGLAFDVPGRVGDEQTIARQPADSR